MNEPRNQSAEESGMVPEHFDIIKAVDELFDKAAPGQILREWQEWKCGQWPQASAPVVAGEKTLGQILWESEGMLWANGTTPWSENHRGIQEDFQKMAEAVAKIAVERAELDRDQLMERSALAMHIAEGDEGWQDATIDCPMLDAVIRLRQKYQMLSDLYRPTIKEVDELASLRQAIESKDKALRMISEIAPITKPAAIKEPHIHYNNGWDAGQFLLATIARAALAAPSVEGQSK